MKPKPNLQAYFNFYILFMRVIVHNTARSSSDYLSSPYLQTIIIAHMLSLINGIVIYLFNLNK